MLILGCGGAHPTPATGTTPTKTCASAAVAPVAAKVVEGSPTHVDVDAVAQELLRRINANDGPGVVALFDDSMRSVFPIEKTGPFIDGLVDAQGKIASLSREEGVGNDYHGVYRFYAERGGWRVELNINPGGQVTGLEVKGDPVVAKSTIDLGLPYHGQWSVVWGGTEPR